MANRRVIESSLTKYNEVNYERIIPSLMKNIKLLNNGKAHIKILKKM